MPDYHPPFPQMVSVLHTYNGHWGFGGHEIQKKVHAPCRYLSSEFWGKGWARIRPFDFMHAWAGAYYNGAKDKSLVVNSSSQPLVSIPVSKSEMREGRNDNDKIKTNCNALYAWEIGGRADKRNNNNKKNGGRSRLCNMTKGKSQDRRRPFVSLQWDNGGLRRRLSPCSGPSFDSRS